MAKNKVQIDVSVDDKGTTKKVALGAKQAGEGLDKVATSARTADRNMKGVSQQSANGTKNFSKMAQGMGGLVGIYATIAAQVFAVSAAFQFFKEAADLRVIKDSQIAYSSATGIGMMTLTKQIKQATDGLVGFKDAAAAAAIGTASGLSQEQIRGFAQGAKEVSQILGRDVTDSFNRLIRGVTKAEPELLDELGITLRLADATEKYAATLGKTAKELSLYEKSQAVAVEVQDQLDKKYASVAASVELQSNAVAQLGVAFEKVYHPIQQFVAAIAEPTALFLADNIKALTAALGLLALPIIKAIIPGLSDWAENSRLASEAASQSLKEARLEMEALKQASVELSQSGADPRAAAQQALQGVKSTSSGVKKLQGGDFGSLTKREIKGLLRAAEDGKGAVTQMSNEMKRQYIAALRSMAGETQKTGAKISASFADIKTRAILSFKQMQAAWGIMIARMKQGVAALSRAMNTAMKLAGWVGFALLIKDLLVSVGNMFDFFKQSQVVEDFANKFDSIIEATKTATEEFQKFEEIQRKFFEKNAFSKPDLDGLSAIGNVIDSNRKAFIDSIEAQKEYNKYLEDTPDQKNRLKIAQEEVNVIQAKIDRQKELRAEQLAQVKAGTFQGYRVMQVSGEDGAALKAAQRRVEAIKAETQARKDQMSVNIGEEMLGYTDIQEKFTKAVEGTKKSATQLAAGLRAAKIETQEGGPDFLKLLDTLAATGELSEENQKRFDALADSLVGIGATARLAKQEFTELQRIFDQKMSSITEFTTSVTDAINRSEALLREYQTGLLKDEEGRDKTIASIKRNLEGLNKIRAMEVNTQLRSLAIELAKEKAMIGATTLEKESINRRVKLAEIENQRMGLQERLALAMADETKIDQNKINALMMQLEILDAQEESVLRQQDILLDTIDKMEEAFEQGFQKNLADIIKGNISSLRDAAANIAKSVLETAADNLAKGLTSMLFGDKSPEGKIKTAMMQGADYTAEEIRAAMEGRSSSNASSGAAGEGGRLGVWDSVKKLGSDLWGSAGTEGRTTTDPNGVAGETKVVPGRGMVGLFTEFTRDLKSVFSKDTPFLEGLQNLFMNFGTNIGGLFTSLLGGLSGIFASLFGGSTSTSSQIGSLFLSSLVSAGASAAGNYFASSANTAQLASAQASNTAAVQSDLASKIKIGPTGRYGGVMSNGSKVAGYSMGGVAKGPNAGYPAVLHGTEAVVPLPNNRSIPVDLKGSGQQNNVTVNVSVNSDGSKSEDKQADSNMGANLGTAISAAVQRELQNQKRSGGILNPYGVA